MSKFLLNLLLQIFKALVNSKIQFLIQKFFSLLSARPTLWPTRPLAQLAHWPRCPHRLKPPWPAHQARASVASSRKYVFPCGSRLPSWSPPSRLSVKWGRAISFIFLPLRPPHAARPPTSIYPARYSLHALIPLLNFTR
jgi:hypothetical protein